MTQAEAKEYLPEGWFISRETQWHNRWKVLFKFGGKCGYTRSVQVQKGDNDNPALKEALVHAWSVHTQLTGEPCPWKLDQQILVQPEPE